MDKIIPSLQTYKGRDRILRLFSYMSKLAAGLTNSPDTAIRLDRFSSQLSTSRTCFRLLDDLPTLKDVFENINQKDASPSTLSLVENTIDIVFNILDHLSWAIEHKIIISNSSVPDIASTYCWVISLYINLYKISKKLAVLSDKKSECDLKTAKENIASQQWNLEMTALKCLADLLFAVGYLPKGILWGSFFSKWQIGALGSFSSLVGLYQALML